MLTWGIPALDLLVAFKSFQWMDERSSACYCIFTRDQEAADFVAHYVTKNWNVRLFALIFKTCTF